MSRKFDLTDLRIKLDEAITYSSPEEAMKLAREGLKQAEGSGRLNEIEYFKGQLEILNENFTKAIEHFDAAIKYNPADGAAYNDRALCMVELGMIDEALAYFDKGIEAEPDYANIYHNKGWLLNNIGRHSEAIACFNQALHLEPKRPVTYDNLADALLSLGDLRGARVAYRKVLVLLKPGSCDEIKAEIIQKIKSLEIKIAQK